eukprot:1687112-Prorocentrum_lima.AAC.1
MQPFCSGQLTPQQDKQNNTCERKEEDGLPMRGCAISMWGMQSEVLLVQDTLQGAEGGWPPSGK